MIEQTIHLWSDVVLNIVQTIAIVVAGIWALKKFNSVEKDQIFPSPSVLIAPPTSSWFNEAEGAFQIGTLCSIVNSENSVICVVSMKVELVSIKDSFDLDYINGVADISQDAIVADSSRVQTMVTREIDVGNEANRTVGRGGTFSKDILFVIKKENAANWIASHRLMFLVTAEVENALGESHTLKSSSALSAIALPESESR